jgi:hypothetical protein
VYLLRAVLELTTFTGNMTQWRPNCRKLDDALSGHRSSQQREPLGQLAPFAHSRPKKPAQTPITRNARTYPSALNELQSSRLQNETPLSRSIPSR